LYAFEQITSTLGLELLHISDEDNHKREVVGVDAITTQKRSKYTTTKHAIST
jgi:hypothetical protein